VLALAGLIAVAQRGEGRERGVQAGEIVGEEGRRLHRLAVGEPFNDRSRSRCASGVVADANRGSGPHWP
jgi:hypothetical protein